jgi:hypothetical protein
MGEIILFGVIGCVVGFVGSGWVDRVDLASRILILTLSNQSQKLSYSMSYSLFHVRYSLPSLKMVGVVGRLTIHSQTHYPNHLERWKRVSHMVNKPKVLESSLL